MKIWFAITLLSTALWSVSAANNLVKIKNNKDFDQTIQKHDMVLVKFSDPKCTNCKKMEPKVEKAASALKKDKVLVAEVDCHSNKSVCDKYKVKTYPTLQVFKEGRPSNLMMKAKRRLMARDENSGLVEIHNQEELETLKKNESFVAVAYLDPDEQNALDAWNQLSKKLGNDVTFGLVTDKAMLEAEGAPSVVLYKKFDSMRDVYKDAMEVEKIQDFIKINSVPLLAPMEPATYMDYVEANRPLVYIFSDSKEQQDQMQSLFLPLAEKYKGEFTFAHINPNEYEEHADFMNIKEKKWPAVAVHDFKKDARIPLPETKTVNEKDVTEFLEEIKKSNTDKDQVEESALNPELAVAEVTQDNYDDVVMDTSKDVLLEVYAPWCGHCKKLAPTYQQLGEFMQANKANEHGVVVAKMDGTKFKVPENAGFKLKAYPTIKLIKAGSNQVVDYKGQRTLEDFVEFLNKESTKQTLKVDLSRLPTKGKEATMDHARIQVEGNKQDQA